MNKLTGNMAIELLPHGITAFSYHLGDRGRRSRGVRNRDTGRLIRGEANALTGRYLTHEDNLAGLVAATGHA